MLSAKSNGTARRKEPQTGLMGIAEKGVWREKNEGERG